MFVPTVPYDNIGEDIPSDISIYVSDNSSSERTETYTVTFSTVDDASHSVTYDIDI